MPLLSGGFSFQMTLVPQNRRRGVLVEYLPVLAVTFVSSYTMPPIGLWPAPIDRSRREKANGTSHEEGN